MTESMTTQTEERKYTLNEISSAWYQCYREILEDDYYGFIQTLKYSEPVTEEPCDRCPSQSMSWCQSNGCPRESEDEEYFGTDESFMELATRLINKKHAEMLLRKKKEQEEEDGECNCESDDEYSVSESGCDNLGCGVKKEEVDSFIYNSYKCKHSDCDYETLNTNPDCTKCGKEYCMLAQSNEGSSEYEIECCYEAEHGGGIANSFKSKEEAMEEFERVTNYDKEDQYHVVYLNERLLDKNGDLYSSDEIKVWRRDSGTKTKKIKFNVKK